MFYGKPLNKTLNAAFNSPLLRRHTENEKAFPLHFSHTGRRKRRNRNLNKLSCLPEFANGVDSLPENKPFAL
jgi:hypothetical protein